MSKQKYETRGGKDDAQKQMEFQHIVNREKIDRTETSFAGNGRLSQNKMKKNFDLAQRVSRKWF